MDLETQLVPERSGTGAEGVQARTLTGRVEVEIRTLRERETETEIEETEVGTGSETDQETGQETGQEKGPGTGQETVTEAGGSGTSQRETEGPAVVAEVDVGLVYTVTTITV